MVGVIIATHRNLGKELIKAAENILGPVEKCQVVSIETGNRREDICGKFSHAIKEVNSEDGVLILTDMFGGSACNIGYSFSGNNSLRIVTGVNLPMILELATHRNLDDLRKLALLIERTGRASILRADEILREKSKKV
ncbi:PTS sugar transporter subunit IIA [bacterium]|nr:PTS sugar transporter subunit IIA [bacterium]MCK4326617.1 PTS sugar transporter subunit IIA [bacterium]MCK4437157.1 PTS sugar transporter subunit IIA [bacterium]